MFVLVGMLYPVSTCHLLSYFVFPPISTSHVLSYCYIAAGSCLPDDDSWKFYDDRCYYFSGIDSEPEATSWYNAQGWCNQNGGHLVSVHDPDTQAFITGQVIQVGPGYPCKQYLTFVNNFFHFGKHPLHVFMSIHHSFQIINKTAELKVHYCNMEAIKTGRVLSEGQVSCCL